MLAGVNSDEQCEEHKSRTVMTHAERCEAVRHCRWVDEVVPDAPWVIDQAFLDKVCSAFIGVSSSFCFSVIAIAFWMGVMRELTLTFFGGMVVF